MTLHVGSMTVAQQEAVRQLAAVEKPPLMYLAGGAAVALHCGHRQSIDLDWFLQEPLDDPMRLAERLRESGVAWDTQFVERGTLHGAIGGVRVSFLEYSYELLMPLVEQPPFDCAIASVEDLAAMKLLAVAQRGAKKDFLDVYALGSRIVLAEMLNLYRKKFAVDDVSRVLYGLCYFQDADAEPMPHMLIDTDWQSIKQTIETWVKQLAGGK